MRNKSVTFNRAVKYIIYICSLRKTPYWKLRVTNLLLASDVLTSITTDNSFINILQWFFEINVHKNRSWIIYNKAWTSHQKLRYTNCSLSFFSKLNLIPRINLIKKVLNSAQHGTCWCNEPEI
ncbi:hypothetical protein VCUG_01371 [Vavraia culicis subsp. floridensis]|uniref:Uncharacterized protein n=1 Tax=Vavraia culicis (isolate floridensis) TaxID=948595 RepID=L2GUW1_VAVCU|nr:uncharacterized protein VCUG_01371 [Vavraia culicis subsp. floridensis]ELA47098.1 hypothetical protein VCUG_01371 [Vavraia culicis subsp. floridensis]